MDDSPPPYEAKNVGTEDLLHSRPSSEKQQWSLEDQAENYRLWHVFSAAERVQRMLEMRASHGALKTKIVLIPSDQRCDLSREHDVLEYIEDVPVTMELGVDAHNASFWYQDRVVGELRRQVMMNLGTRSRSTRLSVRTEEVHVRSETPFGLYETSRVMAIVMEIE